jgi:hypothetical protein
MEKGSTNVGGNSATLSLTNITAADAGSYTCVVTSTCGNATTTAAVLTVNAVTSITTNLADQAVCKGSSGAIFTVAATGTGIYRINGTMTILMRVQIQIACLLQTLPLPMRVLTPVWLRVFAVQQLPIPPIW